MSSIQRHRSGSECGGKVFEGNCKCAGSKIHRCPLESGRAFKTEKEIKKSFVFRNILLSINLMINLIFLGFHAEIKLFSNLCIYYFQM